jgi:hypothetical protein
MTADPDPPQTNGTTALERMEHLQHWWREPIAGFIAVGLSVFDVWHYGRDAGFTSSLDEILLLTGITLIAGVRNLFGGKANGAPPPPPAKST